MTSRSKCGEKSLAKRKLSIKKKASDLSTLFNAQVCMVFSGVDDDGDFEVWPEGKNKAKDILMTHIEASKMKGNVEEENEAFKEIHSEHIKNQNSMIKWDDEEFNKLSKDSLLALSTYLDAKIQALDEKIEFMKQQTLFSEILPQQNEWKSSTRKWVLEDCHKQR